MRSLYTRVKVTDSFLSITDLEHELRCTLQSQIFNSSTLGLHHIEPAGPICLKSY